MTSIAIWMVMDWEPHTTMPEKERVLVCYLNLYGYNHVTEAYLDEGEEFPTTVSGIVLRGPFMWAKMPEGPKLEK